MADLSGAVPHDNQGPEILGIMWAFTVLMVVVVVVRLLVRVEMTHFAGRDDIVIGMSLVVSVVFTGLATAAVAHGLGKHLWDCETDRISDALKWNTIAMPAGIMSFAIPKLAVVFLIIRTFDPTRIHRIILYTMSGIIILMATINAILIFFQCDPPAGLWDHSIQAQCWQGHPLLKYSIITGAVSSAMDFSFGLFPIIYIAKLQMSRHRKVTLACLMGLGCLAGVVAIVKCTKLTSVIDRADYTYATADLIYWTSVEANVLIIAASIPALGPLLNFVGSRASIHSAGSEERRRGPSYSYNLSALSSASQAIGDKGDENKPAADEERDVESLHIVKQVDVTVEHDDGANRVERWGSVDFDSQERIGVAV